MTYSMRPFGCDPARIKGMSERPIISHYENNYGGAVKRLNLIEEKALRTRLRVSAGIRRERVQARAIDRDELDDPARAVLRWARRAKCTWQGFGGSDRARFWIGREMEIRIHRYGQGAGRWFRLGAAVLVAA